MACGPLVCFLWLSVVPKGGSVVMEILEADEVNMDISSNLSLSSCELILGHFDAIYSSFIDVIDRFSCHIY